MTTLDEVRTTLLAQHKEIRAHIEATRDAASKCRNEKADYEPLRACLSRLASSVRSHNLAEEAALRTVLPTIDAWGAVRTEVMLEEHVAEHAEIYATLVDASLAADPADAADSVVALLARMAEHIAREEKTFLGAEVLSEDPRSDGFGG